MNLSYFISKRVSRESKESFATTIHKIAVLSISIGLAVMLISFLILKGFQETIQNKIYNFSSHLQVTRYTLGNTLEEHPVSLNNEIYTNPEKFNFIDHVQEFSYKAGLIKAEDEVLGVVLKGISPRFDTARFNEYIKKGRFIHFPEDSYSKDVVISQQIADKLDLSVNDDIIIHFFQNPPRFRKLTVSGIYETNLSEYFDDKFIIGDLDLIRRLNDWPDSVAGGMEIFVNDLEKIDQAEETLEDILSYDLFVEKVSDKYIQLFEWLSLISRQVNIFLGVILAVVCVNMISIIMIMIMERTQMIGLLKAIGARNKLIRSIFTYSGVRLLVKGILWGNALALGLAFIQDRFQIIPLNARDYYMSYVPISWHWDIIIILNILTVIIVSVIIMLPTVIISRIQPIKSIKFD
ncbi:MAG: ABC transporter permease [Candidatus Cyclobacteriaceae bacterium M2_1C_046]